jgi:hypothetical protein
MSITVSNGSVFATKVHELLGGHGDRVNKFEISISPPRTLSTLDFLSTTSKNDLGETVDTNLNSRDNKERISMLCKTASIPEMEVGTVDIWRRGHKFTIRDTTKFPGTWTCEFYNDTNLSLRRSFEKWMYEIDKYKALVIPTTKVTNTALLGYMGQVYINKKNAVNSDNITYVLKYAFPIKVSEIQLNTESTGITTFSVTFAYSYWEIEEESSNGILSKILTYI